MKFQKFLEKCQKKYQTINPEPELQFTQTGVDWNPIKSSNPKKYLHLGVWVWKTRFQQVRGSKNIYTKL